MLMDEKTQVQEYFLLEMDTNQSYFFGILSMSEGSRDASTNSFLLYI